MGLYKVFVTYNNQSDVFSTSTHTAFEGSLADCHNFINNYKPSWQDRVIGIKFNFFFNKGRLMFSKRFLQHTHYSSVNKFHKPQNIKQTIV
jgi:hypothetical protein